MQEIESIHLICLIYKSHRIQLVQNLDYIVQTCWFMYSPQNRCTNSENAGDFAVLITLGAQS